MKFTPNQFDDSPFLRLAIRLLFVCFCLVTRSRAAQAEVSAFETAHKDFIRLYMADETNVKLGYQYQPGNDDKGSDGSFDLNRFYVHTDLPTPISRDEFVRFGLDYEARKMSIDDNPTAGTDVDEDTFHKLAVKIGLGWFWNKDLMLTGMISPGLYSNFDNGVSEDDLKILGDALMVYRFNPGAQVVAGLAVSEVYDDVPIMPLLGFRMQSEDGKLLLKVTLPVEAKLSLNVETDLQCYAGVWVTGDEYRVNLGHISEDFNASVRDDHFGVGATYWLSNSFNVGVEAGLSIGSELNYKVRNNGQFDGDLETAPYVGASVGVNL